MFNVGGAEMLVIFLVALLILGPDKLPAAARQAGTFMAKVRRYSDGFRNEIQRAMDDAIETDAKESGAKLAKSEQPDPDFHEVKAVAEPDTHQAERPATAGADADAAKPVPSADGAKSPAREPARPEATLRAVPDPAARAPEADDAGGSSSGAAAV